MFLLVKNKEAVGCLYSALTVFLQICAKNQKKTPDKTTNFSLMQEVDLFEAEISLKGEALVS